MSNEREILLPDIGDFETVEVIEILVKQGDSVRQEDSLITLESDKATMDIPSPAAGVVKHVRISVGDKIAEGTPIIVLEETDSPEPKEAKVEKIAEDKAEQQVETPAKQDTNHSSVAAQQPVPGPRTAPSSPTSSETVGTSKSTLL